MKRGFSILAALLMLCSALACRGTSLPGEENFPLRVVGEAPSESPAVETTQAPPADTPVPETTADEDGFGAREIDILPEETPAPTPEPVVTTPEPTAEPATPVPVSDTATEKALLLAELAENLLGKPYAKGGVSPSEGFDTSGLVYYCLSAVGETISRKSSKAYSEMESWQKITDMASLLPGDLLFYRTGDSTEVNCVCIYIGDGKMVYASSSGEAVVRDNVEKNYWISSFAFARRALA